MLNEFLRYVTVGFWHLFSWSAFLNILFVLTILVAVDLKNWKKLLSLILMFIIGVTISIILSSYNIINVKYSFIKLMIPVTVLIMSLFNFINAKLKDNPFQLVLVIIFGVIHGLGFAHVLSLKSSILLPSISFSLGIGIGVLAIMLIASIITLIISILSKVNKNNVNSVLNALCMIISIYYIYKIYF